MFNRAPKDMQELARYRRGGREKGLTSVSHLLEWAFEHFSVVELALEQSDIEVES